MMDASSWTPCDDGRLNGMVLGGALASELPVFPASAPRRWISACSSEMNWARCWAKMLNGRRNSLFRTLSAALRKPRSPRSQVSTKPLRIEITSLLLIYQCHLLLMTAQLVYHSLPFPYHCDVNGFHRFLGFHSAGRGTITRSPRAIFRQMACRKNWKRAGTDP